MGGTEGSLQERIEKAGLWAIGAFLASFGLILAWKILREGFDSVLAGDRLVLEPWERTVICVPLALVLLASLAVRLYEGWRFLVDSHHEGRTIFVQRILSAREACLVERIEHLERQLTDLAMCDGVLRARGLEITDAHDAPILTVGKTERGATTLTLGGAARGTAASLVVSEHGSCVELRDTAGRLRFRAAVLRDDVWLTLQDAKEEPRAGFLVKAGSARILLPDPAAPNASGGTAPPGYL